MSNLANAKQSPRAVNGVLKWYQDDTFDLAITFDLTDQDEEPIAVPTDAVVDVIFYDKTKKPVKQFSFNLIQSDTVTLRFDETVTALFPADSYTYDVYMESAAFGRKTLANNNEVVVE